MPNAMKWHARPRQMPRLSAKNFLVLATLLVALPAAAEQHSKHLEILVYGGTGMVGQRIVNEALSRGDKVTMVVRDPSTAKETKPGVTLLQGNLLEPEKLGEQIAGHDVVIEAVSSRASTDPSTRPSGPPAPGSPPPPPPQVEHFYTRVAENLVAAARSLGPHKAPRLLFVGGAASLNDTDGTLLFDKIPGAPKTSDLWTTKEALDYLLTVKDVSWTVLSPAQELAPGERTGKFRLGDDTIVRDANGKSSISVEDYAVAMIDEAHNPKHIRKRFTLAY